MESSPNDGKEEKIGGKESDGVENERGNPHMKKKGFPQGFIFPHTITHLFLQYENEKQKIMDFHIEGRGAPTAVFFIILFPPHTKILGNERIMKRHLTVGD